MSSVKWPTHPGHSQSCDSTSQRRLCMLAAKLNRKHESSILTLKCLGLEMMNFAPVHISVATVVTKPFLIQVDWTIGPLCPGRRATHTWVSTGSLSINSNRVGDQ